MEMKVIEMTNVGPQAKQHGRGGQTSVHRSIYLPLLRTLTPRSLEVFDFAEQGLVTGSRDTTTVATQALYLLNDPFVRQQANSWRPGSSSTAPMTTAASSLAYRLTLGRPASAKETERARSYGSPMLRKAADSPNAAWASFCQALLASAEFRYIK